MTDFLTHPRFVLVDNRDDADILWLREHFKDFRLVYVLCFLLLVLGDKYEAVHIGDKLMLKWRRKLGLVG